MNLCTRCRSVGALLLLPPFLALSGCDRAVGADAQAASAAAVETTTVTVKPRDFVKKLRLTGLTEATRSYIVSTPLLAGATRGSLVVTKLAPAGTAVKPGDLLVQFDSQIQEKAAIDKKAEYQELVQQIRQKRAEQDAARIKDESELAQARNAVKKFELEVLKNEMLSRVLAEKNDQDLAEARSKVEALDEVYKLKRQAAGAELRMLEIRRDCAKAAMDYALENSKDMTVMSPLEGLVVPKLTWRGNGPADIQEGDEMWPGAPVLQVVNQASMQVRARVNQADAPTVRAGMPVVVRLTRTRISRCPAPSRRSRRSASPDRFRRACARLPPWSPSPARTPGSCRISRPRLTSKSSVPRAPSSCRGRR